MFSSYANFSRGKSLIGHFRVPKTLLFRQNESTCTIFLVKMSFICMRIKNDFHINSFAVSLALKLRLEAIRKWPILTGFFLVHQHGHRDMMWKRSIGNLVVRAWPTPISNQHLKSGKIISSPPSATKPNTNFNHSKLAYCFPALHVDKLCKQDDFRSSWKSIVVARLYNYSKNSRRCQSVKSSSPYSISVGNRSDWSFLYGIDGQSTTKNPRDLKWLLPVLIDSLSAAEYLLHLVIITFNNCQFVVLLLLLFFRNSAHPTYSLQYFWEVRESRTNFLTLNLIAWSCEIVLVSLTSI